MPKNIILVFPNQKLYVTKEVLLIIRDCYSALKTGNRAHRNSTARAVMNRGIKDAKVAYKSEIKDHFKSRRLGIQHNTAAMPLLSLPTLAEEHSPCPHQPAAPTHLPWKELQVRCMWTWGTLLVQMEYLEKLLKPCVFQLSAIFTKMFNFSRPLLIFQTCLTLHVLYLSARSFWRVNLGKSPLTWFGKGRSKPWESL